MSINYVIASYPGSERRTQPNSGNILNIHLYQLYNILKKKKEENIPNLIKQITVIRTKCKNSNFFKDYYRCLSLKEVLGVPIKVIEYKGSNNDHSYDQWLMGMEMSSDIDYHLVMEDDHCVDNLYFDLELIDMYNNFFQEKKGYLCCLTLDEPIYHAAIPHGIFHRNILNYMSLDKYYNTITQYTYPQLKFCELMNKNNIQTKDFADKYYMPFWNTDKQGITDYTKNKSINKRLIVPVQLIEYFSLSPQDLEKLLNQFITL
jgi:hypothetical protein